MTIIAFQGQHGAYSDLACRIAFPNMATLPCESFEAAIAAVHEGQAALAMLPPENSLAGRVADMHALLRSSARNFSGWSIACSPCRGRGLRISSAYIRIPWRWDRSAG